MNLLVAHLTDDQGLTMAHCHPLYPLRLLFAPATFSDEVQKGCGISHLAYLSPLVLRSPVPLRHVRGFPALRLLRGLRHPRTRVP
jgi:hypothetical protein